jgi:hypothetical protein
VVNNLQSLAAKSGRAVMVKPALEILSLARRSWAQVGPEPSKAKPRTTIIDSNKSSPLNGFLMVYSPALYITDRGR